MAIPEMVGRGLAALGLCVATGYAAHALVRRLLAGERSRAVLWAAAGVAWTWVLLAVFQGLAAGGVFALPAACASAAVLALGARLALDPGGALPGRLAAEAWDALRAFAREAGSPRGLLPLAAFALVLATTVRAALAPPLTWDSLTYHLYKAGRWVQEGGFFELQAPDAWNYYRFFPANGDALSAWFLLPFHGDLAVNLTNLVPWGTALLASYALARHLGVERRPAWLAALALGFTPIVFVEVRTTLVEVQLLAGLLTGALFLLRFLRAGRAGDAAVAGIALGGALGTKVVALPMTLTAGGLVVLWAVARALPARRALVGLALLATGALPSLRWYAAAWRAGGSPVHPFPLRVLGHELAPGERSLAFLLERMNALYADVPTREVGLRFAELLKWDYATVGPWTALVLVLAPFGALALWRRGRRGELLALALLTASVLQGFFNPDLRGAQLHWMKATCRFLGVPLALLTAIAVPVADGATGRAALVRGGIGLAIGVALVRDVPLDWAERALASPWLGGAAGLVLLLACGGAARAVSALPERPSRRAGRIAAALLATALVLAAPLVERARAADRYERFLTQSDQPGNTWRFAVEAWEHCDRPEHPQRIAFVAGWSANGHNWYWYPFLGRYLQNSVTYVPVTRDGSIVDYQDASSLAELQDFEAWLTRLVAARIDLVVTLPAPTPEFAWAAAHPELFRREARPTGRFAELADPRGFGVFRLDREAARAALGG